MLIGPTAAIPIATLGTVHHTIRRYRRQVTRCCLRGTTRRLRGSEKYFGAPTGAQRLHELGQREETRFQGFSRNMARTNFAICGMGEVVGNRASRRNPNTNMCSASRGAGVGWPSPRREPTRPSSTNESRTLILGITSRDLFISQNSSTTRARRLHGSRQTGRKGSRLCILLVYMCIGLFPGTTNLRTHVWPKAWPSYVCGCW